MAAKKARMRNVVVVGRRWRDFAGNTYHSVQIFVNGKEVGYVGETYGYGNQYEWTAAEWLMDNGYRRKTKKGTSLSRVLGKVPYSSEVIDVKRKKDL